MRPHAGQTGPSYHSTPESKCEPSWLSDQDHLHQILVKHARAARVPVGEKRRHGMHSLRQIADSARLSVAGALKLGWNAD